MRAPLVALIFFAALWAVSAAWGDCPTIKLFRRSVKSGTNKEINMHISLKNDGLVSYTNYFVAVSIPRGAKYLGSVTSIANRNAPDVSPTVTDGVILWRFPRLPLKARVKLSTNFKVDQYCIPEGMLEFQIRGYHVLNSSADCLRTLLPAVSAPWFSYG